MVKAKRRKKRSGNPNPVEAQAASVKSLLGNSFWNIRSKHGRDVLFASPKLMWEAACEYFQWCEDNPLYRAENKIVSKGSGDGSMVELHTEPLKRVFSLHGLCLYLNCGISYFRQFRESKAYKLDTGFSIIIDNIEKTIFQQQFEGASAGQFNANIISRSLGLVDKQDVTSAGEKIEAPKFNVYNTGPDLAGEEKTVETKRKAK